MEKNDFDIEKLLSDNLRNAVDEPPAGAWESISERLAANSTAGANSALSRASHRGLWVTAGVLAVAAVATVALFQIGGDDKESAKTVQPQEIVAEAVISDVSDVAETKDYRTEQLVADKNIEMSRPKNQTKAVVSDKDKSPSNTIVTTPQPVTGNASKTTLVTEQPQVNASASVPASTTTQTNVKQEVKLQEEQPAFVDSVSDGADNPTPQTLNVPNLITPNGDGYNDCWIIPDLEKYGTARVQIYNAQNRRVYSSNDYKNTFCGDNLPDGNYFYILVLPDSKITRRGALVISR